MTRSRLRLLLLPLLCCTCCAPAAVDPADGLQLTLPPVIYGVPEVELGLYYDNVVLTETPEAYQFKVTCDVGAQEEKRWVVTPTAAQVGDHPLSVAVSQDGKQLGECSSILRISPADAGAGRKITLLIVGDSLTHATYYPTRIGQLLSLPGNPAWTMLGTNEGRNPGPGVRHEGWGGWTWNRFATHHERNPDGTYKKMSSPMVFLDADGKPQLDLERYFTEKCGGQKPDYVTFLLGINDCFSASPDDPDPRIDTMFTNADLLLDAFREVCPDAQLGICLTTPPNSRQSGFTANYKDRYPRWGWKRIQHRLVQRELEKFEGREAENFFIVPTEINLDPVAGYPENNGVHPVKVGYDQIGDSIYAWLKARFAATAAK